MLWYHVLYCFPVLSLIFKIVGLNEQNEYLKKSETDINILLFGCCILKIIAALGYLWLTLNIGDCNILPKLLFSLLN